MRSFGWSTTGDKGDLAQTPSIRDAEPSPGSASLSGTLSMWQGPYSVRQCQKCQKGVREALGTFGTLLG